jgi:aminopeptidase N
MDDGRACSLRHEGGDEFTLPGAAKHYPPDLEIEPIHLDIRLTVDVDAESASGTVTHSVQARRAGPTTLRLHAVGLDIDSIRDVDGHAVTWSYDSKEIVADWAEPFGQDEQRRLAISYRVERPAAGLYFSRPSDAYPHQARYAATDCETERARHWLPCIDLPNARPRLDFHLRARSEFTILANGELLDETDHGDGSKTAHWQLDHPCPSYLTCFAIGDFIRADDGEFDGRPVAYFAVREFAPDDLRRAFGRTREMLDWLTRKLGMPFPFPKYFQFALPGFGGAMENISLVSWDDSFVMDETLALEATRRVDEVNIHEMAHSYFGDAVVIRDYAHAWLKESWATYIEQCWFEENWSRDEQLYQYYSDAQAYFREADERYKRPIVTREFHTSWEMYDRHLYPGGACRLHTLRNELDDAVFWEAVRDYLATYSGKVVETDDFRRMMELHSGRSLGQFFDQWFHTAGYPAIKVAFHYDGKRREGVFEIEQTQVDDKANVPAFQLTTDLGWVIDGQLNTIPLRLDQQRQTVVVAMERDPDQVRFDPFAKALHKLEFNPSEEKLRRQLTEASDVIGRILAGRELAKSGTARNVEAIRVAYGAEPFWGVKVELARALADSGSDAAVAALADLIAQERDPVVQEPLLRAAAKVRDIRIREAVQARLGEGLPYRATQAAYEALGAQRDDAPFELLAGAAEVEGFGGIAQSGALRALAATRRAEAIPILLERSRYGATSNRARPAAVGALGEIGRTAERGERERIVERLVDLLRDPERRVRGAAVGALQEMRAREATDALGAYRASLSDQERVRIDRALRAVRAGDDSKVTALEKQVEELQSKLRELQGTLQKLEARVDLDDRRDGAPPRSPSSMAPTETPS